MKRKEWRQFEILIARLEAVLGTEGCVVTSPDDLLDHDTGEKREVDGSVRDANGRAFLSIECRKRKKVQDVLWIEQLACKMDALKLLATIAVSSRGFSKSARLKAGRRGIVLRTYKEVVATDLLATLRGEIQFQHSSRVWTLLELQIRTQDDTPHFTEQSFIAFQDAIARAPSVAPFLVDNEKRKLSMVIFVDRCLRQVTLTPGTRTGRLTCKFEANSMFLDTPTPIPLSEVAVALRIEAAERTLEDARFFRYESADGVLLETATVEASTAQHGRVSLEAVFRRG